MREILFRGQTRRKGQKVWMDGTPVDSNWVEGYGVCMGKGDFSVIYAGDHVAKFPVYTDTVGQYTGLTDKNGKKIFEGDILREESYLFVVVWVQAWAKFRLQNIGRCIQHPEWNRGIQMEIVGNIHDNPELL